MWLSLDGASSWINYNLALIHNSLEKNSKLHFCPGVVNARPANSTEYFLARSNHSYFELAKKFWLSVTLKFISQFIAQ